MIELEIIQEQIKLLADRSKNGTLDREDVEKLAILIKSRLMIEAKTKPTEDDAGDDLKNFDVEVLKQLLIGVPGG